MKALLKKIANLPALKTDRKLIIFLSDDWGSLRIKSLQDQRQLLEKGLKINSRFDTFDTLETNVDMERLFEVLTKHRDCAGNHPVITAVTNVGNPDFERIQDNNFQEYYYESIEKTYQRYASSDKVLDLTKQGIKQNIFVPQCHGREHLQFNWWMDELRDKESFARKAFDNKFFFLGADFLTNPKRGRGLGAAFDVWDINDVDTGKETIKSALDIFEKLYGYRSELFIPPAMYYNTKLENSMVQSGIKWLDVGRFFKVPVVGGAERYQYNYLGRKKKSGLKVLVRNCVFESNMSENDNGVNRCLNDIEEAFLNKQPAIISNHRASFVAGIDPKNRDKGLNALNELFKEILVKWPDAEFVSSDVLNKL